MHAEMKMGKSYEARMYTVWDLIKEIWVVLIIAIC
jgi:uncharacterized membrane protein YraQ (UPF0718 family)